MNKIRRLTPFIMISCLFSIFGASEALAKTQMFKYTQGFFPFFAGSFCIFPLIMSVVWIILAIWVYKDAEQRGENAVLWLLIVLLTGIVGLIYGFL